MSDVLGKNIKYYREMKGWKAKDLAERLGVSASAISEYERGKSSPSRKNEVKLAEIFEIELADLHKRPDSNTALEPNPLYGTKRVVSELESRINLQSEFIASLKDQVEQLKAHNRRLGQMYDFLIRKTGVGSEVATPS